MSPKIRLMILAGTALATGVASAQSLDQTREYAAEVVADAQQRTSLLDSAQGSNAQFGLTSDDGSSTLNFSGWHQTRYAITIRDDAGNADEDDLETGFFTPDTRLIFDGSVVSPDTTYKIELYFDSNGDVGLMDAFLNHDFGNGTAGRIGQFTAPVTRESMVEDNQLQTIERTPTDWVFSAGQVQGAAISFTDEANSYRVTGSLNDGARTGNSPYNAFTSPDTVPGDDGGIAITVRGDMAFEGTVDPYFATTRLMPGGENAMILGGYIHFEQSPDVGDNGDTSLIAAGVDFLMDNGNGWNFFAAGHLQSIDSDAAGDDFLNLGLVLQGGYFVSENTEIFGSFDMVIPDDDLAADADPFNTLQVGVNHFPFQGSQAVKLSAGVTIFIDAQTETGGLVMPNSDAGLLADSEGGQVTAMGQAQVSF